MNHSHVRLDFSDQQIAAIAAGVSASDEADRREPLHDFRDNAAVLHSNGHVEDRLRDHSWYGRTSYMLNVVNEVSNALPEHDGLSLKGGGPFRVVLKQPDDVTCESKHRIRLVAARLEPRGMAT